MDFPPPQATYSTQSSPCTVWEVKLQTSFYLALSCSPMKKSPVSSLLPSSPHLSIAPPPSHTANRPAAVFPPWILLSQELLIIL